MLFEIVSQEVTEMLICPTDENKIDLLNLNFVN